jgi:hypothetical protein
MSLIDYRDTLAHQRLVRDLTTFERLRLSLLDKWLYIKLIGYAPIGFSREAKVAVQEIKRRLR